MNVRSLATLLVKRPKMVILVFTIITILMGYQATNIYMESDLTTFLPKDDPTIQLWERIDQEFQIGSTILIYVEADDIRDPEVLKEIDRVSSSPKINPYENDEGELDGVFSVQSLSILIKEENAKPKALGGLGGEGKKEIPDDENLISRYLTRTVVSQMKNVLYTNTYNVTVIIIQLAENANYEEILEKARDAIEHRGTHYTEMTITGTIALQKAIQKYNMRYLLIIFPIALIFVSAVLIFFHRSIKGIIIAFLPPAYAIALTFGIVGTIQPALTMLSISIGALLIGLGVDYSIHLMNRFAEEHTVEDRIQRLEITLRSTGKAVLLSTITTMIGFGSLMISSMSPIVTFGFACVIGILFCFISAIILVPCLVVILKFGKNGSIPSWKKFALFTINNRKRIIFIACFFAVMSLVLLPQIKTDVNYLEMAPEDIPELEKLREYSANFGSGVNFNALFVETNPQGLTYPETIDAIYEMENKIRAEGVNAYSLADELKDIYDILERKTIVGKLSDMIDVDQILFDKIAKEGLIDEDFSKTMILVYIPVENSIENIEKLVNEINDIAAETALPHGGKVSYITGQDAVNVAINKKLADEQTRSMIIAILLVLAALIIIFNSSKYGLLTMIPVAFVLIWEPGFLVALDIPLSVITISIASIMIGIGIDYGVHITQRIREGLAEGLSKFEATRIAVERTGLSLVEAALTTVAGLSAIYVADIPSIREFGIIIILMTSLSCIAAALILPAFYGLKFSK